MSRLIRLIRPYQTPAANDVRCRPACNPASEINKPPAFVWTDVGHHSVGVMEYGEATVTIIGETLTGCAYR